MIKIITPSTGTPYTIGDVIKSSFGFFRKENSLLYFVDQVKRYLNANNIIAVNSGTSAFYALLLLFKKISDKNRTDVILPAYTAPSLTLPIRKAGLNPKLIDTDSTTFNIDLNKLLNSIDEKTLAVIIVHMFGIPTDFKKIMDQLKSSQVFLVEDAASSFGSKIYGKQTGTIADFGFFSFNRGKNVSNFTGGLIYIRDKELLNKTMEIIDENFSSFSAKQILSILLKIYGLSLAVRPVTYTMLQKLIEKYKYTSLHTDFDSFKYNTVQSSLGESVAKRYNHIAHLRWRNGKMLYNGLKDNKNLTVPKIPADCYVAYNQFPILVNNKDSKYKIESILLDCGIETTFLYEKPIHHFYPELSPDKDNEPFPNSLYLAEHLILLPTHPQISTAKIQNMIDVVNSYAK